MSRTPSLTSDPSDPSTQIPTPVEDQDRICTELHALYCFDVLIAHLEGREPMEPPFENKNEKYALFVTWNTSSNLRPNRKPALRGCIGNFSPMKLAEGLREYALISALEDHRFSPIKANELPHLSCHVSLLTPMTPISSPLDWTPGIHGIHITFPHPDHTGNRTLSATYLPEICPEQGWTKEETILSAIQKAGYKYKVSVGDEVWNSLTVKVYGSEKASVTWDEYKSWSEKALKGVKN
ncbi:uncharacterized protein I303_103282 [Kwoniella dejecticola CBS 10117]|uniref:AMME syndrome candidate protein n=1 Tax=Kwoniella dejecticola CBS 10117 TaxID=1296121 RepID=A0A1A6A6C0_9TREE|nr:AMME syndrome candidate protein [Kwoniella dejecticola CBS 10117]OBR85595.1 AMME syndrome candidate protein [Kwoniella dejecticola CBS 10117]